MNDIRVLFTKLHTDAQIPEYATRGSAGADLHAIEDYVLKPGSVYLIRTGLAIAIPPEVEGQIRPRSGLAIKYGITLINSPATIDSDYRGELKVPLINFSRNNFVIKTGDRIGQIIFSSFFKGHFIETSKLDETSRGTGGLGSTGI